MNQRILWLAGAATALAVATCSAAVTKKETTQTYGNGSFELNTQIGLGYWDGDVSYDIGKTATWPDGTKERQNWPLSRLEFPLGVAILQGGADFLIHNRLEGFANVYMNLSDPSKQMKDSDWTDDDNPHRKTIYSESDADLKAWGADAGLRYWVYTPKHKTMEWGVGVGAGYLYQDLDWEMSNLDQWYPDTPEWGHIYVDETCLKYKAKVQMPYGEIAGRFKWRGLSVRLNCAYSPYTMVDDEDDHLLRSIKSATDATGQGWKTGLRVKYQITDFWFVALNEQAFGFSVDGDSKNEIYDGWDAGQTWSIYEEISSTQIQSTMETGFRF